VLFEVDEAKVRVNEKDIPTLAAVKKLLAATS
jgi:hypothetical protein